MKTSPAAPARPSTAFRARLWRLAAIGLVAPVAALAACSGASSGSGGSAANATGAGSVSTSSSTGDPTTPSPTSTTDGPASEKVAYSTVQAVIEDPDLGHTITAVRIARHLKWPGGQPVSAQQFEIVGVRLVVKAGSRYSADITPSMFSLVAANPPQTIDPTFEWKYGWGATPLATVPRSQTATGWIFFKVDRGTTSSLKLVFNRPAYEVSTTGRSFPAKTFSAVLVK